MSKPKIKISCSWKCPDCHKNILSDIKPGKCLCCNSSFMGRIVTCEFVYIGGGGSSKPKISKSYEWECPNCNMLIISRTRPYKCHECSTIFRGHIVSRRDVVLIDGRGSAKMEHELPSDEHKVNKKADKRNSIRPTVYCYHCGREKLNDKCVNARCKEYNGSRCYRCNQPTSDDICNNPCCVEYDVSLDRIEQVEHRFVENRVNGNSDRLRNIEKNIRNIKRVLSMN